VYACFAPCWPQNNLIFIALQLQGIAGIDLQGVPNRLRQDYPAGFIDGQNGIHNGI
jgi:hypothetical protein